MRRLATPFQLPLIRKAIPISFISLSSKMIQKILISRLFTLFHFPLAKCLSPYDPIIFRFTFNLYTCCQDPLESIFMPQAPSMLLPRYKKDRFSHDLSDKILIPRPVRSLFAIFQYFYLKKELRNFFDFLRLHS